MGLERDNVSSLCTVHRGDNRETCKSIGKVADRVILGLLPTPRSFGRLWKYCLILGE